MRFARSHDGQSFVMYHSQPPGSYVKVVLTANEAYALADALRRFAEDRERQPVAAEAATEEGV